MALLLLTSDGADVAASAKGLHSTNPRHHMPRLSLTAVAAPGCQRFPSQRVPEDTEDTALKNAQQVLALTTIASGMPQTPPAFALLPSSVPDC